MSVREFKVNELMVKIDKQFTDPQSVFYLNVEELFVFFILNANERRNGTIETSLDILKRMIPFKIGSKNITVKQLAEILDNLLQKDIINISEKLFEKGEDVNAEKLFTVKIEYENFESDKNWLGFNQIPYSILKKIKRMEHLYIYCSIIKFNNSRKGGFDCSYSQWSYMLNRSQRTVKRHINELLDLGVIFILKRNDDYNFRKKQQSTNIYRTSTHLDEKTEVEEKTKSDDTHPF